jgi:hypothetical protein
MEAARVGDLMDEWLEEAAREEDTDTLWVQL